MIIFFSTASACEILFKSSMVRVVLPDDPEQFIPNPLAANNFQVLSPFSCAWAESISSARTALQSPLIGY